jgi:hypothetical protein
VGDKTKIDRTAAVALRVLGFHRIQDSGDDIIYAF